MATPRLGAPELTSGQAVPETTVNETFYWLDAASGGCFKFLDRDLATPPGSPAQGATYLVAASGTGAWSGHDGDIAIFIGTAWEFTNPDEGFIARVADENIWIGYDGAAWTTLTTGGSLPTEATAAEVRTGTATGKYVSPDNMFDAAAVVALTPGANVSLDMATGFNFSLAMGGDYQLDNPTNPKVGQSGFITITQDGTGSRLLTYGTNWEFAAGSAPVLSTTINTKDVLFYQVLGTTSIFANLVKAVA